LALVALGIVTVATMVRSDGKAGPCVVTQRSTNLPDIPEASGLAISRRHPGILWSHNDSGNTSVLFAIDAKGAVRGRLRLPVVTRDWEDISAARCPAGDCLYIADIGDNQLARSRLPIYRIPEPALDADVTAEPETFTAIYADGPHNAEAAFVLGDHLFVITRERHTAVYRSALPRSGPATLTLERIGSLDLTPVTDAEASPDGTRIAVRTSKIVAIYRAAEMARGGAVRPESRVSIEWLKEPQGEGVAIGADGMLFLASEGRRWDRGGWFTSLRCAP
jgi:hypothetical protein